MNVAQFLEATKISLNRLSQLSGVNYGTLHAHVKKAGPIGLRAAKKLEAVVVEGSDARMSAAEILGLTTKPTAAA
jgi:hypothetical protein